MEPRALEMLMMAALLQLSPYCPSASAASFSRGRNACGGTGAQLSPSSSSPLPALGAGGARGLTWLVCRGPMVLVV